MQVTRITASQGQSLKATYLNAIEQKQSNIKQRMSQMDFENAKEKKKMEEAVNDLDGRLNSLKEQIRSLSFTE